MQTFGVRICVHQYHSCCWWGGDGQFATERSRSDILAFGSQVLSLSQKCRIAHLCALPKENSSSLQFLCQRRRGQLHPTPAPLGLPAGANWAFSAAPQCHDAAHVFRLLQQATLSLFRKTCAHLTQTGLRCAALALSGAGRVFLCLLFAISVFYPQNCIFPAVFF